MEHKDFNYASWNIQNNQNLESLDYTQMAKSFTQQIETNNLTVNEFTRSRTFDTLFFLVQEEATLS